MEEKMHEDNRKKSEYNDYQRTTAWATIFNIKKRCHFSNIYYNEMRQIRMSYQLQENSENASKCSVTEYCDFVLLNCIVKLIYSLSITAGIFQKIAGCGAEAIH